MLELTDILEARERIQSDILHTPLVRVPALDARLGCTVYIKAECTQITGAFKLRGAMNALRQLSAEERSRGVVCHSSGNHAQGVAYAAKVLGVNAKIVMPHGANPAKLALVKSHGAEVVLVDVLERAQAAQRIADEEGRTLIHPFAADDVKAGQGTCGLEIVEDLPEVDAVVVPIGGGGLISGIATAVKANRPEARVYGVESVAAPRYSNCLKAGHCHDLESLGETIADATRGVNTDESSFEIISERVDAIELVSDDWIKKALRLVLERSHILAEPSSCMGPAAALAGRLPITPSDRVVFVLSGGNCDLDLIASILSSPESRLDD